MISSQAIETDPAGPGLFRLDHVFPQPGMYHLRFSSSDGGFMPDDVPLLHAVSAAPPTPTSKTPFPALFVLVALGAVAVVRQRR